MVDRVWVDLGARYIEPDVNLLRGFDPRPASSSVPLSTLTRPLVSEAEYVEDDPFKECFVDIISRSNDDGERVVTTVEIVSVANKTPGQGMSQYLRKQSEVIRVGVGLVEIDLLRRGHHVTAVPHRKLVEFGGGYDYHVSVVRPDQTGKFFVYPFGLRDGLPDIAVPLLPGEGEVPLRLRAAFDRAYGNGPYDRRLKFEREPPPPQIGSADLVWLREFIA